MSSSVAASSGFLLAVLASMLINRIPNEPVPAQLIPTEQIKAAKPKAPQLESIRQLWKDLSGDHQSISRKTSQSKFTPVCTDPTQLVYFDGPYGCSSIFLLFILSFDPEFQFPDGWTEMNTLRGIYVQDSETPVLLDADISRLIRLQYLINDGFFGEIPSEIGKLTSLLHLDMNDSEITGTLPSQLGKLTLLDYFDINDAKTSGTIPSEILSLTGLKTFDISENNLTGTPALMTAFPHITYLDLSNVAMHGTIPLELIDLTNLEYFDISRSYTHSTIPSQLGLMTQLTTLFLQGNTLSGTIPTELCLLTRLTDIDFSDNKLTGTLPEDFVNFANISFFNIQHNQLHGTLPATLRNHILCDFSGLEDSFCARVCPKCKESELSIRGCNEKGHEQICLPGYFLLPLLIVLVLIVVKIIYTVLPPGSSRFYVGIVSLFTIFGILDLSTDIIVASLTSNKRIAELGWLFIALGVFGNACLSFHAISSAVSQSTLEATQSRQNIRHRLIDKELMYSLAVALCVAYIPILPVILDQIKLDQYVRLKASVIALKLGATIPQIILQSILMSEHQDMRWVLGFSISLSGASTCVMLSVIGLIAFKRWRNTAA